MRHYWKPFRLLFAILLMSGGPGINYVNAVDLHDGWAVLSEASTDYYYRDRDYSDVVTFTAMTRLPELAKNGRPRQKTVAEAIIDTVGKKVIADAVAAESLKKLRTDEKQAQMKILVGGMISQAEQASRNAEQMFGGKRTTAPEAAPDNGFGGLFMGTMMSLGGSATRMAEADFAAASARLKLRAAWEAKVFPAIRNMQATESKTALMSGEITCDGANRRVWSAIRNTAGKTLTNVTIIFRSKDKGSRKESDLPAQIYFIRDWPKDVVIRPDSFRMKSMGNGIPGVEAPDWLSATLEVWSDQGHAAPVDAKRVGFYHYRDQFMERLIQEGARYTQGEAGAKTILEFTKVVKENNGQTVEAKLTRPLAGNKDKTEELRFKGSWLTGPNPKPTGNQDKAYSEAVHPSVKLTQLDAPALPSPAKKTRNSVKQDPEYPKLIFTWKHPQFQIETPTGEKFAMQPYADTKSAK